EVSRLALGGRIRLTCAEPSLNAGRNSEPCAERTTTDPTAAAPTTAAIFQGCRQENAMRRPPTALTPRTTGPSRRRTVAADRGRSHRHRTGVTVMETTSDARMLTTYATPMGTKRRPSIPVRANSGAYTTTTRSVPTTIGFRTSLDAR